MGWEKGKTPLKEDRKNPLNDKKTTDLNVKMTSVSKLQESIRPHQLIPLFV
jgi:hypothetical protein